MKVVSVINYKGGVGKTSITANVAAELAFRGKKVLMIDLDPQTNLTFSFIRVADWEKHFAENKTIKQSFDSLLKGEKFDISTLIHEPTRVKSRLNGSGTLKIICSHLGLINVDLELATLLTGSSLRQSKQNFIRVHRRLADGLGAIAENAYDLVLIDCPPNFNIVTRTAIVASDYILVPTRPDYLSTLGIDYLYRSVNELIRDYNEYAKEGSEKVQEIDPINIGVLFNMIQERSGGPIQAQDTYIQQLRRRSDLNTFVNYVKRNDTLFADAPESGIPVVLTAHNNPTYRGVVQGLERITAEFATAIGL